MELKDILQQMITQTMQANTPADLIVGTVTQGSPLEISINPQMAPLKSPVLSLTWPVVEHKVDLPAVNIPGVGTVNLGSVTITEALKTGDKVTLIRAQGGQRFIVLSKIEG